MSIHGTKTMLHPHPTPPPPLSLLHSPMASKNGVLLPFLLSAIAAVTLSSLSLAAEASPASAAATRRSQEPREAVRAGYYLAADAHLRPLAALDASLYTHLYYYAVAVHPARRTLLLPPDPAAASLLGDFSRAVKAKNAAVKTVLSIGGGGGGAGGGAAAAAGSGSGSDPAFAAMAADPASRAAFIGAAVAVARENGFDGLDVAWRFPASAVEMAEFGFLVAEWRAAVPRGFLLTATVYFSNHVFDAPFAGVDYPSEAVARSLDWVNVMAFGLRPPGAANATAFDAPLYDRASHYSASYGVVSWLDAGVPASKVVMGIPLYGRSWFLRNKANNGVGAPVVAAGPKQRGSNATGAMSYAEVQWLAATATRGSRAVITAYDNASVASYVSVGDVWVAFDGVAVVAEKLAFAARCGLLGYFLWPVNYDEANLTVSRRASQVWTQTKISPEFKNVTGGARQTQAPVQRPPALQSPAPTTAPMSSSSFSRLSWRMLDVRLHLGALLLPLLVCSQI
uniref:GH18 domain-containing protein n=1 Tax=Oryza meridionalis TaxID=40149 RepID=A0A0E0DD77_9ORYZ